MKNRLKGRGRDLKNFDDLLKNIEAKQETLLDDWDLRISELQAKQLTDEGTDIQKVLIYKNHYDRNDLKEEMPSLDYYFEVLRSLNNLKAEFDKVNYDEMTEEEQDEYGKQTPEKAEECNKRYTQVCKEYGLEGFIITHRSERGDYLSLKPAFSFLDKLPEDYRKKRDRKTKKLTERVDKKIEELERQETKKKGDTPTS